MLSDIRSTISELREEPRRMRVHPGMVEELAMFLDGIYSVLDSEDPKEIPTGEKWDMLRSRMHRSVRMLHHFCREAGLPPDFFMRRRRERMLKDK